MSNSSLCSLKSSFLFPVTRTASTQPIRAPLETVKRALHDPPTIIKLDPLVQSCSPSTAQVRLWNVVNRMKISFFSFPLKYTALFRPSPDGTTVDVKTGPLRLRNMWSASSSEGKTTELSMEVQTCTFFLLMPLLSGAIKKNHDTMMKGLISKIELQEAQDSTKGPEKS